MGNFYLFNLNDTVDDIMDQKIDINLLMMVFQSIISAISLICFILIKCFERKKKILDILMIFMLLLIISMFFLSFYFFYLDRHVLDILYEAYGGYRKGEKTFSLAF
jgi:amino acid permease